MKYLIFAIGCLASTSFSMDMQQYFPRLDGTVAELVDSKQATNYLHLLPREVLARHVLPCIIKASTSGIIVGLLAGKDTLNDQLEARIAHIDRQDASKLARIPRLIGFSSELDKRAELDEMALNALEHNNVAELDYFLFKHRNLLTREMKAMPLKSLAHERRLSQTMQKRVDEKASACPQLSRFFFSSLGKFANGVLSILPLLIAGGYALQKWPTSQQFDDCKSKYWNPVQVSSRASDSPCNITQIHLVQGNIWNCLNEATTEICNGYQHQQIFINFLPLIAAAFIIAGVQGVLLVLKKCCYARAPLSPATQELVVLYDQLITQAEQGMLPEADEI